MENSLSNEQFRPVMNETREIRVFLSSTFSDMQEERDALIKLFDKLRVIAFRRDVYLSVIDLRWGVTEEESKSGKVLSLCLNEIDKSRPFFIGLLGSKYGSCPEANALDGNLSILEQNPWLAEAIHENKSITEIEILYGALQNDKDTEAVFYIRENVNDENTKLTQLKQKLLNQTRFPVGMYSSIEGLCRQVEKDILLLLDTHFPDTGLTFLQKEKYIWQSYARIKHSHFIKREYYANQLYDFFSGNNNKLLLTGEKDSGKSAILSNYLLSDKRIDNFIVFCRFLDNPLARHDYQDVLRDLIAFLKECYGLSIEDEPSHSDEQQIASLIKKASRDNSRPPLLIVLDGLERLGAENALNLLYWLPDEKSVRYIVSTRLGTPYVNSVLCNRGFVDVEVSSPRLREFQLSFIQLFLSSVGKKLSDSQLSRILNDKENESISVLRALLNELVSFGSFEYLDDEISFYTQSRSIEDFYNCIIEKKKTIFPLKA